MSEGNVKFEFKMDGAEKIAKKRGLDSAGFVQKYIDSEVLRLSHPYVPMDISAGAMGGGLVRSGISSTVLGSGEVKWRTPYARKMYYNPQYNFQGAPNRGGKWFERMKVASGKGIIAGANKLAGGK